MIASKEQTWYANPELGLPALSEVRYITFPRDALIAAIKFLAASANPPLPHGKLESCEVRSEPDIAVVLGIRDETTGALVKEQVDSDKPPDLGNSLPIPPGVQLGKTSTTLLLKSMATPGPQASTSPKASADANASGAASPSPSPTATADGGGSEAASPSPSPSATATTGT